MIVRFKLNCGPSACQTVCGEPHGLIFFREPFHPYLAIQQQPHAKKNKTASCGNHHLNWNTIIYSRYKCIPSCSTANFI